MANIHFFRNSKLAEIALTTVLAAVVIVCLVAITPMLWTVVREAAVQQSADDPRECLVIKDDAERLKCFETRIDRPIQQPARGANAPSSIFGHAHQESR